MSEIDELRARVSELKQRLIKLKPSEALRVELRERDLPPDRVDDAIRLIGGAYSDGAWTTPGNSRPRSVAELVDEFESDRGYMFRDVRAPAQPAAFDLRTHYPDGTRLPTDQIDYFALAGPTPGSETEQPSEVQPGESSVDVDFRLAGPMPVQGVSDSGLEEWNDDLDAQAAYRESVNRERVEALKKSGMRIDEPVREWIKP